MYNSIVVDMNLLNGVLNEKKVKKRSLEIRDKRYFMTENVKVMKRDKKHKPLSPNSLSTAEFNHVSMA